MRPLCPLLVCLSSLPISAHAEPVGEESSALDDWSLIPILFYTPETSLGLGVAVIHSFDPSEGTASLSTLAAGVIVTAEEQLIARIEPDVRFPGAILHGVIRFQRYPTRFFSPGAHPDDAGERYDEMTFWSYLDARYRVAPKGRPWDFAAVGGRCDLQWNEIRDTRQGGLLETLDPLGTEPFVGLGCGPVLAIDTRDDVRLPTHGVYAELRTGGWTALSGAPFRALRTDFDFRAFADLGRGHVLASELRFQTTAGELPFQLQPRLGGSNVLRGWFEGHIRDPNALLLQLEWRFPLVWKFGAAIFAGTGQAFRRFADFALDDFRFAAGAGLRFLLNKKQTVTVRADVAYGSDLGVYVDVLEAF